MINTIRKLFRYYRPGACLELIALAMMILAVGFFIPVLAEYYRTGLVERFPTLIVCGFAAIGALLSFFSGQILKSINQKNRQDFEINLNRAMEELRTQKSR